jgi:hypothetical protein
MFHVIEYDEDPALSQQPNNEEHDSEPVIIPRQEYQLDFCPSSDTKKSISIQKKKTTSTNHINSWQQFLHTPKQVLVDLFLPLGYPHSVDSSYLAYQFYDSLQGLCSYLRGVVSTSAVLTAAGVGDSEATAMGAAMTWALKDGMGMVGGLMFSYFASPHFDALVKEFRLFADLINDVGLTLDMAAPLVPSRLLLPLLSLSTLSKTMCGMSAGATKSSITVHLAKEGNMADLNAKEGTQETLVSLLGMLMGVQLAKQLEKLEQNYHDEPLTLHGSLPKEWQIVPVDLAVSWAIFLFLTWLHMWANYRGVKLLKLNTLNRERAIEALEGLTSRLAQNCCSSKDTDKESPADIIKKHEFPTPHDVDDSMVRATCNLLFPRQQSVVLGTSLLESLRCSSSLDPRQLFQEFDQDKYILGAYYSPGSRRSIKVYATLRTGAQKVDELKAFLHSIVLYKCLVASATISSDPLVVIQR